MNQRIMAITNSTYIFVKGRRVVGSAVCGLPQPAEAARRLRDEKYPGASVFTLLSTESYEFEPGGEHDNG